MSADTLSADTREPQPLRWLGGPLDGLDCTDEAGLGASDQLVVEIDTFDGFLSYYKAGADGAMHWIGTHRKEDA